MTEPTSAAPAQAADGAQPQEGTGTPPAGAPSGTQLTDPTALQRELDEARKEAAKHRTALKQYQDAEAAASEAAKSELQKAVERAEKAERERDAGVAQVQAYQLRLATIEVARALGFRNPEIAYRLVSPSEVEYNADGAPKNIEGLLTKIATSDPYLINGQAGTPRPADFGGGPRGTPSGPDVNSMIRRAAGRG